MALHRYKVNVVKPIVAKAEAQDRILLGEKPEKRAFVPLSADTWVLQRAAEAIQHAPILTIRENRIAEQQKRHALLEQVRTERAADMELCESCRRDRATHPWEEWHEGKDKEGKPQQFRRGCSLFIEVPGGKTGLVIRKLKATGVEYAIDTGLLSEYREHEKHIAIEIGQWQEGTTGNVSIQIVCPTAPLDAMPRITFAAPDGVGEIEGVFSDVGLLQGK